MRLTIDIEITMLASMNWQNIVSDILAAGYTQADIAIIAGVKQPSICDIATGKTKSPSWGVGDALIRLHRRVQRRQKAFAQ